LPAQCELFPPLLTQRAALVNGNVCQAAVVDPAEPEKALAAARGRGVSIDALLCTHKHGDHAGGNAELARALPGLPVVASAAEEGVPAVTHALRDGGTFELG
jgi:glyoxylase-like metal-dependent hydrolase (beta-lactamase superfamily II)